MKTSHLVSSHGRRSGRRAGITSRLPWLFVAALIVLAAAPVVMAKVQPAGQPPVAEHAGGEASLILPDLGTVGG